MDIYLVGGAVRDKLLGLPVQERDWVVVGATPEALTSQGYKTVGRDFPVFLHPETGEEYALARTERKTGAGHRGFECDSSTTVTLEDDLERRDFTINAIAEDDDGKLIDPYGGRRDLEARILRHVSPAFEEDPLRVVRAARFMAKFHRFDFRLADDTRTLMRRMVSRGDLDELTPERVFAELQKALVTDSPDVFFRQLQDFGAHDLLWPEVTAEGIALLTRMATLTADPVARFTALLADRPPEQTRELCRRLKVASKFSEPAELVCRYYDNWTNVLQMTATDVAGLLHDMDAFRRQERFTVVSDICRLIDMAGDGDMAQRKHQLWMQCQAAAANVRAADIDADVTGRDLGTAIREKQIELIHDIKGS